MPKARDTTRGQRQVFGSRDEMPGPTPGGAEGERDRDNQSRLSVPGPTPSKAEGELFPEG